MYFELIKHLIYIAYKPQIGDTDSVTRWTNCAFNICPFSAMKMCPIAYKLCQWVENFAQNQINLKYIATDFKLFAKVVEFRQIWSHWTLNKTISINY